MKQLYNRIDVAGLVAAEHLNLDEVFESVRPANIATAAEYANYEDREHYAGDPVWWPLVLQEVSAYGIRAWRWFDPHDEDAGDWMLKRSEAVKAARKLAKRITKEFYED
jgi:hypothetical protein